MLTIGVDQLQVKSVDTDYFELNAYLSSPISAIVSVFAFSSNYFSFTLEYEHITSVNFNRTHDRGFISIVFMHENNCVRKVFKLTNEHGWYQCRTITLMCMYRCIQRHSRLLMAYSCPELFYSRLPSGLSRIDSIWKIK
jgi:hypothetical protein